MKLYNFDDKHQRINGELDLKDFTNSQIDAIEKTIQWLDEQDFTSRYHELVLADSWIRTYEDGEPYITFQKQKMRRKVWKSGL